MTETDTAYVDWKRWQGKTFGEFTPDEARYFSAETSLNSTSLMRVLEIGFGNGNFLGWVTSIGGEAFGIESNSLLVARARLLLETGRVFETLNDPRLSQLEGHFTHVVAFDVIEHIAIDELPVMLTEIEKLLASDGRVIIRFPNGDSPFGRITQHGDPTHVTTIGYQKLEYLAHNAGLEIADIRAPACPIAGVGLARGVKRLLLRIGRWVIERLISLLYYGGRRVPLDPNYLAILVRARQR